MLSFFYIAVVSGELDGSFSFWLVFMVRALLNGRIWCGFCGCGFYDENHTVWWNHVVFVVFIIKTTNFSENHIHTTQNRSVKLPPE